MSNIYYLAVGKGTNYAGRLYRMRPNAIHKETVGVGVTGYIVLSDDVVYYCDGERVIKAKSWRGVQLKLRDDEELNEEGEIVEKIATSSSLPIIDDNGKPFEAELLDLPKPDEEIMISDESKKSIDDEVLVIRESTTKVDDEILVVRESTKAVKEELDDQEVGPKVVEVEAPR